MTRIKKTKPDIELITISDANIDRYDSIFPRNEKCPDTAEYYHNILNPDSMYHQKGFLIYNNGNLLGVNSFVGQKILLALADNSPLKKVHLYDLPEEIDEMLKILYRDKDDTFGTNDWIRLDFSGEFVLGQTASRPGCTEYDSYMRGLEAYVSGDIGWKKINGSVQELPISKYFLEKRIDEKIFFKNMKTLYDNNRNRTRMHVRF